MLFLPLLLALTPEAWFDEQCADHKFQGVAMVRHRGKTVFGRACGEGNTVDTQFRIASITKEFTAVAILMLRQAGKLNVNDAVGKYVDGLPLGWRSATLHQLLTHTSGIPSYTGKPIPELDRLGATPNQLLDVVRDKPLAFAHGTKMQYNNTGYVLLGMVIERVSQVPYARFIETFVLLPGMRYTRFDSDNSAGSRGQVLKGGVLEPAPHVEASVPWAAGGFRSSAEEMLLWAEKLTTLLTPESQEMRTRVYAETSLQGMHYGYGVVLAERFGRRLEYHGGGISGFSSVLQHYPDDQLSIAVLSNLDLDSARIPAWTLADGLAKLIFGVR